MEPADETADEMADETADEMADEMAFEPSELIQGTGTTGGRATLQCPAISSFSIS